MKYSVLIAAICATLALVACGEADTAETAKLTVSSAEPGKAKAGKLTEPKIQPPSGPPPKELVIGDIEEGSGPEAEMGDKMVVHYLGVDKTGKVTYTSWPSGPLTFKLGAGGLYFKGWDEGLEGMKAGGRRELIFPASLTGESGPLFYVVDLLAIDPPDDSAKSLPSDQSS